MWRVAWLSLILVFAVGCSKGPLPEEEKEAPPPWPVELELAVPNHLEAHLAGVIRDFDREHPQILVRTKTFNTPAEFEGLGSFDLLYGFAGEALARHQRGAVLDLSSLQMPEWDPLVADLIESASHVDGQRIWLPLFLDPTVVHVRPFNFQLGGVALPSHEWTYAEFEDALRALSLAGSKSGLDVNQLFSTVIHGFGGSVYDEGSGRWQFNTPENQRAFEFLAGLVKDGLVHADFEFTVPKDPAIVMAPASRRPFSGVTAVPMPSGPNGRWTSVQIYGLTVTGDTQHPEAAITFALYLLSPKGQAALGASGVRPIIENREATVSWRTAIGNDSAALIDQSLMGAHHPRGSFSMPVVELIQAMLRGEVPIGETLARLDELLN